MAFLLSFTIQDILTLKIAVEKRGDFEWLFLIQFFLPTASRSPRSPKFKREKVPVLRVGALRMVKLP